MGQAPNWTAAELEFLEEKWGVLSIKAIAKHLNRSIEGVRIKAQRTGLSDARFSGDGITLNQLAKALNTEYSVLKYWCRHNGFPAKPKVFAISNRVLVVQYHDFWKWAESHKNLINLARLEPGLLGPEPAWTKEKRRFDELSYQKIKVRVWTAADDSKLRSMVNAYRYTYPEIARTLKRSESAVKRRLLDLGIKARPVRLNNHTKWTDEEVGLLLELFHKGCGYNTMAEKLGKSELGIRGKLERMNIRFSGSVAK